MRFSILIGLLVGCSTPKQLDLDYNAEKPGGAAAPVLVQMRAELDRSLAELKVRGTPPPYFVAYEVSDVRSASIAAEFGALLQSDDGRVRELDVDVRVGDPKLDNTHALRERDPYAFLSRRFGRATHLPIEDDQAALRATLWLTTDERYKDAVERLVKIRSERAIDAPDEDDSDDFSADKAGTFVGAPATLELDRGVWEKRVRSLSALFRARPEIVQGKAELQLSAETRYLTSSEGASLQRGATHARLMFTVQAKADDGMDLQLTDTADASSLAKLPDEATLQARVKALIDQVVALRVAKVAEPYVGPAILDGRAASVFFHETFGHRVEGPWLAAMRPTTKACPG